MAMHTAISQYKTYRLVTQKVSQSKTMILSQAWMETKFWGYSSDIKYI